MSRSFGQTRKVRTDESRIPSRCPKRAATRTLIKRRIRFMAVSSPNRVEDGMVSEGFGVDIHQRGGAGHDGQEQGVDLRQQLGHVEARRPDFGVVEAGIAIGLGYLRLR